MKNQTKTTNFVNIEIEVYEIIVSECVLELYYFLFLLSLNERKREQNVKIIINNKKKRRILNVLCAR